MVADDDDQLLDELAVALSPEGRTPPPERIAELRAAAADRVADVPAATSLARRPASRLGRYLTVAAAAAAVVVAFVVGGLVLGDSPTRTSDLLAAGVVEFEVTLVDPDGVDTATATGIRTGIGRIVQLRTDELPILPTGELYELWFVGPDDTPRRPNRISAGTFHPDERGISHVDLTAAVDPAKYPRLSITAEPGDGNPAATGPEVLRGTITLDHP